MARITSGPFAGFEAVVLETVGEQLTVEVEMFGRARKVEVRREQIVLDDEDPRIRLRQRISEDVRLTTLRRMEEFWVELAEEREGIALAEYQAYLAHCVAAQAAGEERGRSQLAAFEAEVAVLPDDDVEAAVQADAERWLPEEVARDRMKDEWRSQSSVFDEFVRRNERQRARRARGAEAYEDDCFRQWRAEHMDDAKGRKLAAEADAEAEQLRPVLVERFEGEWGLILPEALLRFWTFYRSLQPVELETLRYLELVPFGVMDLFAKPDAQPREGIDIRAHGRFYRDPPEMLTFMHGGADGLHYGLWYADGRSSTGVVSYYNSDGGTLGLPHGTPLTAVRASLEIAWQHLTQEETSDDERRTRSFPLRLLRSAIQRYETGEQPETGEAWHKAHVAPLLTAARSGDIPGTMGTVDGAGALVEGITTHQRGRLGQCVEGSAVFEELWRTLWDGSPEVLGWVEAARRRLGEGDPADALCLGRDLHWCSGGDEGREALAVELLAGAYRKLGRDSLAGIVQAHHRHRALPGVNVLSEET